MKRLVFWCVGTCGWRKSLHGEAAAAVHTYCFLFSVFELLLRTEDNGDDDNCDDIIIIY